LLSDTTSDNPASRKDEPRCRIPPWSWSVLVSALAWAVIIIAIPPSRQDFPLGDDWAFARGAIWFAHGEGIHYSKWASMPQLGQWLWSWPFLLVIGSSHFALRISGIALSWLGMVSFYDLLRQNKVPARLAGFAACVIATNPLFFISQGTYMTDVPALSFGLMALNCYSRAINQRNLRWLFGAVVLAVLGAITRQTMIAVPMVAGLLLLRFPEIRLKPFWVLSIVVPVAAGVGTSQWFAHRPDILPMHLTLNSEALVFRPFLALHWCGLAVLPLCLLTLQREFWKLFVTSFIFMMLAVSYLYFLGEDLTYGGSFPYCNGAISPWGVCSGGLLVGQREILLTQPFRIAISILGCIGGAQILTALFDAVQARKSPDLLLLFTALQFLFVLTLPNMMDRYLEVLFPGAVYLVVMRCSVSHSGWLPGTVVVTLCGFISVALFHDWLSWNTARWELGRQAIATKSIQPDDIEGGFEWNGWYASTDPNRPMVGSDPNHPINNEPGLSLPFSRDYFPQVRGRFALAFTQPENSVVVASLPYTLWLSAEQKDFLFVQYKEP
jgi:hypothetical protein